MCVFSTVSVDHDFILLSVKNKTAKFSLAMQR